MENTAMTANQLIAKLTELVNVHGDLTIMIEADCLWSNIAEVTYEKVDKVGEYFEVKGR